jgi:hypothetical protein
MWVKGKAMRPHFDPPRSNKTLFMIEESVQNSAA